MQSEFILVTGANGTGKTTLIENNRPLLEKVGFRIIIPDYILRHATSLTDRSAVIKEHIYAALSTQSPFVLETPFQFEGLVETLTRIRDDGYSMSLYQLFVRSENQSLVRVRDRLNEGGLFIDPDQVKENFIGNLPNVARNYSLFDHSYFIDNSGNQKMKLVAQFKGEKLIMYRALKSAYLLNLFTESARHGKAGKKVLKRIKGDKDLSEKMPPQRRPGRRLKF